MMHQIEPGNELTVPDLGLDILPGGCTEPVIHWRGVVIVVIELIGADPAH